MIVGKVRLSPSFAVVVVGAIVAMSAVLLASPGILLSRQMSWDLLFNLAGAWHLHYGGVANVDFHDPVGQLYFWLTRLGFWLCGPTVREAAGTGALLSEADADDLIDLCQVGIVAAQEIAAVV